MGKDLEIYITQTIVCARMAMRSELQIMKAATARGGNVCMRYWWESQQEGQGETTSVETPEGRLQRLDARESRRDRDREVNLRQIVIGSNW